MRRKKNRAEECAPRIEDMIVAEGPCPYLDSEPVIDVEYSVMRMDVNDGQLHYDSGSSGAVSFSCCGASLEREPTTAEKQEMINRTWNRLGGWRYEQ